MLKKLEIEITPRGVQHYRVWKNIYNLMLNSKLKLINPKMQKVIIKIHFEIIRKTTYISHSKIVFFFFNSPMITLLIILNVYLEIYIRRRKFKKWILHKKKKNVTLTNNFQGLHIKIADHEQHWAGCKCISSDIFRMLICRKRSRFFFSIGIIAQL